MDSAWGIYGGGLLVVLAALALFVGRRRGGQASSVGGAIEQMGEAATLARELVAAAEQLWLTGRLQRGERLEYVMDKLTAVFPGLEREQVYPLVEAAVYWLKLVKLQPPEDLPAALGELLKSQKQDLKTGGGRSLGIGGGPVVGLGGARRDG